MHQSLHTFNVKLIRSIRGFQSLNFLSFLRLSICFTYRSEFRSLVLSVALLKGTDRYFVQPQQALVWVFDEHILSFFHSTHHVYDRTYNSPSIGKIEVHLLCELAGVVAYDAEDDMFVGNFGRDTRYEAAESWLVTLYRGTRGNSYCAV